MGTEHQRNVLPFRTVDRAHSMSLGDEVQTRKIADQVAMAAVEKVLLEHPELKQPGLPKWVINILVPILITSITALGLWLFSSVSSMQVMLARIEERQQNQNTFQAAQATEFDRRISRLEAYHQQGSRQQ